MRLDKLPKTLFIAIFSIFLFVPFVQASPPMCSGTFTLTCTKWENFITGYTCTPPNLVGCYRAHSVSGATDCTIYAGACVPNLAGTLGSMTCSYPYFADVMSNNCSFEPCPDGNPPVNGQCGYVPPHDDPPPPIVFGCNNCTEVYLPTGCSTDPNNANYDPTCHFDHMDCAGHPPGPAPVCHATRQWCDPDNLSTLLQKSGLDPWSKPLFTFIR